MNNFYREINDVSDALRKAKEDKISVNFLIGAGCSVTSDIPTADGFIEEIKKNYNSEYKRASPKTYANCMAKLTPIERKNLITKFVIKAKINWAHICIAQLLKQGYVNRIITTNFDNLLLRACSIVGEFPGVYDLATSNDFRTDLLFDKSILHLHGQYTGFVLCNTKKEVEKQRENLKGIFDELKQNSLWVIVGYSGQNDAILELLTSEKIFEHRLFWVGYKKEELTSKLKRDLLGEEKYAFYVKDYDSDKFFVSLTQMLGCFPPKFIEKPFTYLKDTLSLLCEYKIENTLPFYSFECINVSARNIIQEAVDTYENDKIKLANYYMKFGLISKFFNLLDDCDEEEEELLIEKFRTFINQSARKALDYLKTYNDIDSIKDNEILFNVAEALILTCNEKSDEEAKCNLLKVCKVYRNIYDNSSIDEKLLIRWAECLQKIVKYVRDKDECISFLMEADSKYELAYNLNKENTELLTKWSDLYIEIAQMYEDNNEIIKINLDKAIAKLEIAYHLDQYDSSILTKWGNLLMQSTNIDGNNFEDVIKVACDKFQIAYNLDKSNSYVLLIWGDNLFNLYNRKIKETILLEYILEATDKYKMAYYNNIEKTDILENWSNNLYDLLDGVDNIIIFLPVVKSFIDVIINNIESFKNRKKDSIIININNIAYNLILKGEFEISKQLLDICNENTIEEKIYLATLGFWYFRNNKHDLYESDSLGVQYYSNAINVYKTGKEDDPKFPLALEQKFYYEYSLFLYNRKENYDNAKIYQDKALSIGLVEGYEDSYNEAIKLKQLIEQSYKEIAAGND